MVKRSSRKRPADRLQIPRLESVIDAMVKAAGPVPEHAVEISMINEAGHFFDGTVRGRAALLSFVVQAAHRYFLDEEGKLEPTSRQLASDFNKIELAARRLLAALKVGPNGNLELMPASLRFGELQAFAALEAGPAAEGVALLRTAIQGVDQLARWSAGSRERNEKIERANPPSKGNKPDRALDAFISHVVANCWQIVYRREIAQGPALYRFVQAAAAAVDRELSEDAVRERLRRLLGRRVNRIKKSSDLPGEH